MLPPPATARLGSSGPEVSRLGLGTMAFASPSAEPDECVAVVHAALDAGITFVDTADAYGDGRAESLLGRALAGRRDSVVLASKVGLPVGPPDAGQGLSPAWIATAAEASLRRLGTDHLDLYQLHRPDPEVPLEDTLGALADLVRRGLVRHVGTSVLTPDMLEDVCATADALDAPRPVSDQAPWSLLVRSRETGLLPAARRLGVGVVVWSPLNGGWLTGKYRRGAAPPPDSRGARTGTFVDPSDEAKLGAVERLEAVAAGAGCSLPALALAAADAVEGVASVLLGPRTTGQLSELLAAAAEEVPREALVAAATIVPPGRSVDPRNDAWPDPPAFTHRRAT